MAMSVSDVARPPPSPIVMESPHSAAGSSGGGSSAITVIAYGVRYDMPVSANMRVLALLREVLEQAVPSEEAAAALSKSDALLFYDKAPLTLDMPLHFIPRGAVLHLHTTFPGSSTSSRGSNDRVRVADLSPQVRAASANARPVGLDAEEAERARLLNMHVQRFASRPMASSVMASSHVLGQPGAASSVYGGDAHYAATMPATYMRGAPDMPADAYYRVPIPCTDAYLAARGHPSRATLTPIHTNATRSSSAARRKQQQQQQWVPASRQRSGRGASSSSATFGGMRRGHSASVTSALSATESVSPRRLSTTEKKKSPPLRRRGSVTVRAPSEEQPQSPIYCALGDGSDGASVGSRGTGPVYPQDVRLSPLERSGEAPAPVDETRLPSSPVEDVEASRRRSPSSPALSATEEQAPRLDARAVALPAATTTTTTTTTAAAAAEDGKPPQEDAASLRQQPQEQPLGEDEEGEEEGGDDKKKKRDRKREKREKKKRSRSAKKEERERKEREEREGAVPPSAAGAAPLSANAEESTPASGDKAAAAAAAAAEEEEEVAAAALPPLQEIAPAAPVEDNKLFRVIYFDNRGRGPQDLHREGGLAVPPATASRLWVKRRTAVRALCEYFSVGPNNTVYVGEYPIEDLTMSVDGVVGAARATDSMRRHDPVVFTYANVAYAPRPRLQRRATSSDVLRASQDSFRSRRHSLSRTNSDDVRLEGSADYEGTVRLIDTATETDGVPSMWSAGGGSQRQFPLPPPFPPVAYFSGEEIVPASSARRAAPQRLRSVESQERADAAKGRRSASTVVTTELQSPVGAAAAAAPQPRALSAVEEKMPVAATERVVTPSRENSPVPLSPTHPAAAGDERTASRSPTPALSSHEEVSAAAPTQQKQKQKQQPLRSASSTPVDAPRPVLALSSTEEVAPTSAPAPPPLPPRTQRKASPPAAKNAAQPTPAEGSRNGSFARRSRRSSVRSTLSVHTIDAAGGSPPPSTANETRIGTGITEAPGADVAEQPRLSTSRSRRSPSRSQDDVPAATQLIPPPPPPHDAGAQRPRRRSASVGSPGDSLIHNSGSATPNTIRSQPNSPDGHRALLPERRPRSVDSREEAGSADGPMLRITVRDPRDPERFHVNIPVEGDCAASLIRDWMVECLEEACRASGRQSSGVDDYTNRSLYDLYCGETLIADADTTFDEATGGRNDCIFMLQRRQ